MSQNYLRINNRVNGLTTPTHMDTSLSINQRICFKKRHIINDINSCIVCLGNIPIRFNTKVDELYCTTEQFHHLLLIVTQLHWYVQKYDMFLVCKDGMIQLCKHHTHYIPLISYSPIIDDIYDTFIKLINKLHEVYV